MEISINDNGAARTDGRVHVLGRPSAERARITVGLPDVIEAFEVEAFIPTARACWASAGGLVG